MGLGMGWGTNLAKNRFHLDFEAVYDFQAFWNQNYMNDLGSFPSLGFGSGGDDLYFHGLTFRTRFDF